LVSENIEKIKYSEGIEINEKKNDKESKIFENEINE
jgi:hypothetical protein